LDTKAQGNEIDIVRLRPLPLCPHVLCSLLQSSSDNIGASDLSSLRFRWNEGLKICKIPFGIHPFDPFFALATAAAAAAAREQSEFIYVQIIHARKRETESMIKRIWYAVTINRIRKKELTIYATRLFRPSRA